MGVEEWTERRLLGAIPALWDLFLSLFYADLVVPFYVVLIRGVSLSLSSQYISSCEGRGV
ncbi:hypothetical protein OFB65_25960, partial [Escherichia coli]|nr:hypothetical protein [Escherichia coli]